MFPPNLSVAGTYNVYARWSAAWGRSNNVPFHITCNAGTSGHVIADAVRFVLLP